MHETHDDVRREVTVERDAEAAFDAFTRELGAWWPGAYTFSGEAFATAEVEPRERGRWYERDATGRELAWGEVRGWEPPSRLLLSWRVAADRTQEPPERASEVEVRFLRDREGRTRVVLTHRAFARHGEGAETMRAGMASDQGWRLLLDRFAAYLHDGTPPAHPG
jgi:uncharacterized protein YndB with AHSA1/START domain